MGFFEQYFLDPITTGSGYNIYNTIAYALILIVAVLITYKLLRKMKIEINNKFIIGVSPFIVLGGLLRALEDASVLSGFWFKTPIIYIVIFVAALATLLISKFLEKKLEYYKLWFCFGTAFVLLGLTQTFVAVPFALAAMLALAVFWTLLLLLAKKISDVKSKKLSKFFTWENIAVLDIHLFDATTTFIAIQYFPYFEQHVLPSFLINIFGPVVMFLLKFVVVSIVLVVLDKETKGQERKFLKLIIIILGLGPGLRNFFRLIMGV